MASITEEIGDLMMRLAAPPQIPDVSEDFGKHVEVAITSMTGDIQLNMGLNMN